MINNNLIEKFIDLIDFIEEHALDNKNFILDMNLFKDNFSNKEIVEISNYLNLQGRNPLLKIVETNQFELLEYFINCGVDVNLCDFDSHSRAITTAVIKGNEKIFDYLILKGADFLAPLSNTNTPLMLAALNGHEKILKKLIKLNRDYYKNEDFLNITNNKGMTALAWSIMNNKNRIFDILIEEGYDFEKKSCLLTRSSEKNKSNKNVIWLVEPILYCGIKNKEEFFKKLLSCYIKKYNNFSSKLTKLHKNKNFIKNENLYKLVDAIIEKNRLKKEINKTISKTNNNKINSSRYKPKVQKI